MRGNSNNTKHISSQQMFHNSSALNNKGGGKSNNHRPTASYHQLKNPTNDEMFTQYQIDAKEGSRSQTPTRGEGRNKINIFETN